MVQGSYRSCRSYHKGMASATLISVEQYLRTSYSPDREYLDGRVVERNLGEKDHSILQTEICHIS